MGKSRDTDKRGKYKVVDNKHKSHKFKNKLKPLPTGNSDDTYETYDNSTANEE